MDAKTAEALRYVIDYIKNEDIPYTQHIFPSIEIVETWFMHEAEMQGDETHICECGYEWTPRTTNPKSCPRCKRYDLHKQKEAAQ